LLRSNGRRSSKNAARTTRIRYGKPGRFFRFIRRWRPCIQSMIARGAMKDFVETAN
jgi:hypothetical protein